MRNMPALTSRWLRDVEANARLTSSVGAVVFVLLSAEGVTTVLVHRLLTPHVVIGMILVPPVLVKIATTTYRFARYYRRDPAYRQKGPPHPILRLVGPVVIVLTVVVLGSGVALLLTGHRWRSDLLLVHKVSFVGWFGAMTIHVLGHVFDTARLAPLDWYGRARRDVAGASLRQWTLVATLVVGVLLGVLLAPYVGSYLAGGRIGG